MQKKTLLAVLSGLSTKILKGLNATLTFKHRAGMKKSVEIENVVVSGRRPHGPLLFIDEWMGAARFVARLQWRLR
ncbi:hypothetical protein ABIB83_009013 [Bradyrhizobium sp. I1.8.5]|uniref:hypothetical protein n=1 Tax=Bradyrhizobium sp. I1.8.5 TaxID=3156365 RepID=UPI00339B6B00